MTIKNKLKYVSIILSVICLVLIISQQFNSNQISNEIESVAVLADDTVKESGRASDQIEQSRAQIINNVNNVKVLTSELQGANQQIKLVERKVTEVAGQLGDFGADIDDILAELPEGEVLYTMEDLMEELTDLQNSLNREAIVTLAAATNSIGDVSSSMQVESQELSKTGEEFVGVVEQIGLIAGKNGDISSSVAELNEQQKSSAFIFLVILITSLLITVSSMYFIRLSIAKPLIKIEEVVKAMADGDLTKRLKIETNDEFGQLARHFDHFADSTQNLIFQINSEVHRLVDVAEKLHGLSAGSSESIARQKEQGESVSDAILQMSQSVNEVTQAVIDMAESSRETDSEAQSGSSLLDNNINLMTTLKTDIAQSATTISTLEEDCKEIDTVLEVIRGITEQTNLLALNAAIEAARAGEQGRGFAVVADEVRSLAQRTHDSTREINEIIAKLQEGSRQAVEDMQKSTDAAESATQSAVTIGEMFGKIGLRVTDINQKNNSIAVSAEEQNVMSGEIGRSIDIIKSLNDDSVKDANSVRDASNDVDGTSHKIETLLKKFKVA